MTDRAEGEGSPTIREIGGEFALIERFRRRAGAGKGVVTLGIGDDAALLGPSGVASQTVVTTDLLLEDVHFRRPWCDPYLLGRKAVNVNLSDIAAMAATPTATFVSLALPADLPVSWAEALFEGMCDACEEYGSQIAGGDTNVSPDRVVLSVTQFGRVALGKAVLRSGARPRDVVLVTGELGAAAAGLALLERFGLEEAETVSAEAVRAQLSPSPRLREGAALPGIATAMMDLSDGLVSDLGKLSATSGAGAVIFERGVPVSAAARAAAERLGTDPLAWALAGGEDYELLFTVAPERVEEARRAVHVAGKSRSVVVGRIKEGPGVVIEGQDGIWRDAGSGGWDHFVGSGL